MNFIIIFGPPAVGKMTVGLEVEKLTGLKLFHNHATIEPVLNFFDFGTPPFKRLVHSFRYQIFEEVANSDLPGLIFTFVWDLDDDSDRKFVENACEIFDHKNTTITLIELKADLDERLKRNIMPDRLAAKPSKRNIERSEKNILDWHNNDQIRLNSNGSEDLAYDHIVIENTKQTAKETAQMIVDKLGFSIKS